MTAQLDVSESDAVVLEDELNGQLFTLVFSKTFRALNNKISYKRNLRWFGNDTIYLELQTDVSFFVVYFILHSQNTFHIKKTQYFIDIRVSPSRGIGLKHIRMNTISFGSNR